MKFLKKIVTTIKHPSSLLYPHNYSNEALISYIRKGGVKSEKELDSFRPVIVTSTRED